jgi:probable HAF family extracellular repeat protein
MKTSQHNGISRSLLALTCLLGSIASSPSFAYTLIDLGADVAPKDINNLGIVVGSRNTAQYPTSAFRYTLATGQFEDLGGTIAYAVNDAGLVAGNTLTGAFVLDGNNLRSWDEQGAYGISETGQVSGNKAGKNPYRTTSIPYNPAVYEAGKWSVMDIAQVYPRGTRDGVYADIFLLGDVNDSGNAVGSKRRYGLAGSSAIMITPPYNTINDLADVNYLPTPSGGVASAINNGNKIVGTTGNNSRTDNYATAFVYDGNTGALTLLGTLGGLRSGGLDINESNTVVGSSETDTLSHAFIREDASDMVDLNSMLTESEWVLMSAVAINELGDIVGTGQLGGQNHGFLLVNGDASPPPSSNAAPVAVASADVTAGKAPLTVNFTGVNSSDPDGDSITYHWDFGDSTPASTDANPTHTYNDPGTYPVLLTVSDSQLENSAQLEIRVRRSNGRKK